MENYEIKCHNKCKKCNKKSNLCTFTIMAVLLSVILFLIGIIFGAEYSMGFLANMEIIYAVLGIVILMFGIRVIYQLCSFFKKY